MAETTFVFTIEDVFQITGRGCVVIGVPMPKTSVRDKDSLELRKPDRTVIQTYANAIESGGRGPTVGLLLPPDLEKKDVPVGTELWLVVDEEARQERLTAARENYRKQREIEHEARRKQRELEREARAKKPTDSSE